MSVDGSSLGYAELLKLAVARELQELDVAVVQIPAEANGGHAVVLATARTAKAQYKALGEAWRDTLPADQRWQTLVVAEVRAKTRALSEAVGMPQAVPDAAVPAPPMPERVAPPAAAAPPERPAPPVAAAGREHQMPGSLMLAAAQAPSPADRETPRPAEGPVPPGPPAEAPTAGHPAARAMRPAAPDTAPAVEPAAGPGRGGDLRATQMPPPEGLGPDILRQLIQMTRRKAELEGTDNSEEEAMRKLESFFQRAFGHSMEEGTRMEGQRVRQRLAADLARLTASEDGEESRLANRG